MEHEESLEALFLDEAEEAVAALPDWVQAQMSNVAFFVEAYPSAEVQASLGVEDPYDLLGLYTGTPLPDRGGQYGYGNLPDAIYLYREPILAYCEETGEDLRHCVRHVVVHEVGHYLGLSDAEMEAIEKS
ncbi:MAG: metallopeptidase family protein [Pseudomonadota bacterium]|uniref:metallopeptidase family protein n=1 Tax=Thermithiobacillus tepidarius TaxID=929 RepID=UPI00040D2F83|nr:metallopeptidase family protein [Thermithiobacillus tepidarius]